MYSRYTEEIRKILRRLDTHLYFKNHEIDMYQVYSAIDTIEDTFEAIDFFSSLSTSDYVGELYLNTYGLLQSLFLQQKSTLHMMNSLRLSLDAIDLSFLDKIRKIRNLSIGHPTDYKLRNQFSYSFISRPTMTFKGFELLTYTNGDQESRIIDLVDYIKHQRKKIYEVLSNAIEQLIQIEVNMKKGNSKLLLTSKVPETISWHLSSLSVFFNEILKTDEITQPGSPHYVVLRKYIEETLPKILNEKGIEIEDFESIQYFYKEVEYPVQQLNEFFENAKWKNSDSIKLLNYKYYYFYVRHKIEELIDNLHDIDELLSNV